MKNHYINNLDILTTSDKALACTIVLISFVYFVIWAIRKGWADSEKDIDNDENLGV